MIKTPCQWWLWNYSLSLLSVTNLHTVAPSCVQLKRTRTRRMISVHPSTRRWRSEGSRLEWSGVPPAVSTGPHGAPTALSVTIVLRCAGTHTHTHKCYLSTVAVKFRQNLTSIDTNQLHIYQSSYLGSVLLHTKYWIRWWIFSFHCLMFTWFFFPYWFLCRTLITTVHGWTTVSAGGTTGTFSSSFCHSRLTSWLCLALACSLYSVIAATSTTCTRLSRILNHFPDTGPQ